MALPLIRQSRRPPRAAFLVLALLFGAVTPVDGNGLEVSGTESSTPPAAADGTSPWEAPSDSSLLVLAAASLADGSCLLAMGSDTAGSVRLQAYFYVLK